MKSFLSGRLPILLVLAGLIFITNFIPLAWVPQKVASAAFPSEELSDTGFSPAPLAQTSGAERAKSEKKDRVLPGETTLPSLREFAIQLGSKGEDRPVGLYVDGVMALHIVQQPNGDPSYVSVEHGTATQYYLAQLFGTIGLLAHNFLAGQQFLTLKPGQDLMVIYGGGRVEQYRIAEINDYQRLTLADIHSDFLEVSTRTASSANQIFERYYKRGHVLTLQTCISRYGISDWGVRFILAQPVRASQ